jgi:hypothetical protein
MTRSFIRRSVLSGSSRLFQDTMAIIFPQRMTAEMDGDFVVFLIGMRVNKPWMPRMGLAQAGRHVAAGAHREGARQRLATARDHDGAGAANA